MKMRLAPYIEQSIGLRTIQVHVICASEQKHTPSVGARSLGGKAGDREVCVLAPLGSAGGARLLEKANGFAGETKFPGAAEPSFR